MPAKRYAFEDFVPGWRYESGPRTMSEADIIAFASDWDPQDFHTKPEAAKGTAFGGLVASGWHTGCLAMRLMCDGYLSDSTCAGSPGFDELKFLKPVRPGDTLRFRAEVLEARASQSKPDRGIVSWRWEMVNQEGAVVLSILGKQLFLRRA